MTPEERERAEQFANWLLRVGKGLTDGDDAGLLQECWNWGEKALWSSAVLVNDSQNDASRRSVGSKIDAIISLPEINLEIAVLEVSSTPCDHDHTHYVGNRNKIAKILKVTFNYIRRKYPGDFEDFRKLKGLGYKYTAPSSVSEGFFSSVFTNMMTRGVLTYEQQLIFDEGETQSLVSAMVTSDRPGDALLIDATILRSCVDNTFYVYSLSMPFAGMKFDCPATSFTLFKALPKFLTNWWTMRNAPNNANAGQTQPTTTIEKSLPQLITDIFLGASSSGIYTYTNQLTNVEEDDPVLVIKPNAAWITINGQNTYDAVMDHFATYGLPAGQRRDSNSRLFFYFEKISDVYRIRRSAKIAHPNAFNPPNQVSFGTAWLVARGTSCLEDPNFFST